MSAKRKTAFEVSLNRKGVRPHEPGAVLILRAEQKRHAFAVGLIGREQCRRRAAHTETSRSHRHPDRCGRTETSRRSASCVSRISLIAAVTRGRGASVHTRPIRRMARSSADSGSAASSHWRARRRLSADLRLSATGQRIRLQPAGGDRRMADHAVFRGRTVETIPEPSSIRHLPGDDPMRHGRGHRVETDGLRGERHQSVARSQRFAANCRIAGHHPRHVALEERQDVVGILAGPHLVELDPLPSGGRRPPRPASRCGGMKCSLSSRGMLGAASSSRAMLLSTRLADRRCRLSRAGGISSRRGPLPRCGAVLFEDPDLGAIALVYRPIERRLVFGRPRVRIGAVVEQQFHRVGACRLRRDGVSSGGSSGTGRRCSRSRRRPVESSERPAAVGCHVAAAVRRSGSRASSLSRSGTPSLAGHNAPAPTRRATGASAPGSRPLSTRNRTTSTSADRTASANAVAPARILRADVGASIEEQPQHVDRSRVAGGDQQRRPPGLRPRIHVRSACEENPDLLLVWHRPHQRRRARGAGPIRVGTVVEQELQGPCVTEQCRSHEHRHTVGIGHVRIRATVQHTIDVTGAPR